MMPRYYAVPQQNTNLAAMYLFPGIVAGINVLLEVGVLVFLIMRIVAVFSKFEWMDLVVILGGLLFFLIKFGLSGYCAMYAFGVIDTYKDKTVLIAGIVASVLNLLMLVIFVVTLIMAGLKDPTNLTLYITIIGTVVALLELICSSLLLYLMGLNRPSTMQSAFPMPERTPYAYYPVYQLGQ